MGLRRLMPKRTCARCCFLAWQAAWRPFSLNTAGVGPDSGAAQQPPGWGALPL